MTHAKERFDRRGDRCPSKEQLTILVDSLQAATAPSSSRPSIGASFQTSLELHLERCESCREWLDEYVSRHANGWTALLPKTIPGYRWIRKLGQGGQGSVYLALELATQRNVALKLLPRTESIVAARSVGWQREVMLAARMEHPNLVRLYSIQETDDWVVLVFEYVAAGTLQDNLGLLTDPTETIELIRQIACGVHHIHQQGILHLDIKPSNVLLAPSLDQPHIRWTPKISDFGIARPISHRDPIASDSLPPAGTLSYMAPEQVIGMPGLLSPATDVFALGRLLQTCLVPPSNIEGNTSLSAPSEQRIKELQRVVERCLQDAPPNRFQSAEDLANALHLWLQKSRQLSAQAKSRKGSRRMSAVLATLLLATLVGALFQPVAKWPDAFFVKTRPLGNELPGPSTLQNWISDLDLPADALSEPISLRLSASSQHWTKMALNKPANREAIELSLRFAMMQRAAAERISGSLNTQYIPLARQLLLHALSLAERAQEIDAGNHDAVKERLQANYHLGVLRCTRDDLVEPHQPESLRWAHLAETIRLASVLEDPVQKTFWICRSFDELRLSRKLASWKGQQELANSLEQLECSLLPHLEPADSTASTPDFQIRKKWILDLMERRSTENPNWNLQTLSDDLMGWIAQLANWTISEDATRLAQERLATFFADEIFLKTAAPLQEIPLLDDLCDMLHRTEHGKKLIGKVVHEDLIRYVASISTRCRLEGNLDLAESIQERYLAICDHFLLRFPDEPELHLARSEALLQGWKNALRREDDQMALATLDGSFQAAQQALNLAPHHPLAQHQVADRSKRRIRFQVEHPAPVPTKNGTNSIDQRRLDDDSPLDANL
jgi:serine/threonine protein kinase